MFNTVLLFIACVFVFIEVSLAFASSAYTVDEDVGEANLELTLDGPIDCCSISVTVKVEDVTATGTYS